MKRLLFIALALFAVFVSGTGFAQAQAQIGVKLPPYTREVLPNGVVVLLVPHTGLPLTNVRVLVRGGEESEPSSLAGLSAVTAALLRRGTSTRSADQFSEELDALGGVFGASSDRSATVVTAEFLKKDFERGLGLVADAVLHASFPELEVKNELARRVDGAVAAKDNAQRAIGNYARAAFFGPDHPYGHPADELTLARIKREDVVEYYRRVYCGRNLIVVVSGEFDAGVAKARVAAEFGAVAEGAAYAWKIAPELRRARPRADRPPGPRADARGSVSDSARVVGRLVLIDKPDATQTYFQIVQPGVARKDPDRAALDLVNTLFGGRFTSMLNEELRTNSGLTYGAGARVEEERLPGSIGISSYTKTETTVQAVDLALTILKKLASGGISAEQLQSAKAYVKGQFPTDALETADQLADVVGELELYDLPRDEIDGYFARLDAVTPAQATAVARKYYRSDDLLMVMVGPAAKILDSVKRYDANVVPVPAKTAGWGK